jgi:hypothetical protein
MSSTESLSRGLRLARPFHPWRLRIYAAAALLTSTVFTVATVGVGTGWLAPTRTLDVIANILMAIPILGIPLVALKNAPGERREPLEKAAEFSIVFMTLSASSQLSYELIYVVGHPFGLWHSTGKPGWGWLWWQYAQTDTRYVSSNPWTFACEAVAVMCGVLMAASVRRLLNPALPDLKRLRTLATAYTACAIIAGVTVLYLVAEARVGFKDVGQGDVYGLGFKFLIMNGAFILYPALVMAALSQQISFLGHRLGPHPHPTDFSYSEETL